VIAGYHGATVNQHAGQFPLAFLAWPRISEEAVKLLTRNIDLAYSYIGTLSGNWVHSDHWLGPY